MIKRDFPGRILLLSSDDGMICVRSTSEVCMALPKPQRNIVNTSFRFLLYMCVVSRILTHFSKRGPIVLSRLPMLLKQFRLLFYRDDVRVMVCENPSDQSKFVYVVDFTELSDAILMS